jgi:peptidyl-prolyl cis-trans isomerase SurA
MMRTAIVLIAASILLSVTPGAERLPVDGVVAIVNDDVILASEVGEEINVRLYQYGPEAINSIGMANFTSQILQEMIDNRLLLQQADELEIIVSRDEIDPLVEDNIAAIKEQYPTEEEFEAMLTGYGMTEKKLRKQYRKNIKEQITIKNLVDIEYCPISKSTRMKPNPITSYINRNSIYRLWSISPK